VAGPGGLLNTGACLETVGRACSRIWTASPDFTADDAFMARLEEWCTTGRIAYPEGELRYQAPVGAAASALAAEVAREIRARRVLILMLGDTSMGMINAYFGPRLLAPHGFSEHKNDQAWIIDRGRRIDDARLDAAFAFVRDQGVTFHCASRAPRPSTRTPPGSSSATTSPTRPRPRVPGRLPRHPYQLGLLPLRPPSDLAEGLFNSSCRPETDGHPIACATEADQGNVIPMELMKRLLERKGLHGGVMFHDVRWGAEHEGRFVWLLLNSGSSGAYAFNHDPESLRGAHSYRQSATYFPIPGGTLAGGACRAK
jgi:hypothetical protein